LDDRICTSITPVSLNGFIYMVGCWSADRKPGKYLESLVVSGSFSLPLPLSILYLPFFRLLGHYSATSLAHFLWNCLFAVGKQRMALFPVYDGRFHDDTLVYPILRF
jgi:hypothetical protein